MKKNSFNAKSGSIYAIRSAQFALHCKQMKKYKGCLPKVDGAVLSDCYRPVGSRHPNRDGILANCEAVFEKFAKARGRTNRVVRRLVKVQDAARKSNPNLSRYPH